MRNIIIIMLFSISINAISQTEISVAHGYTSVVLFDSEVNEIINGNELEFVMEKGGTNTASKRIVKISVFSGADPKQGTNCMVFTKDGKYYELDVVLKEKISSKVTHIKGADRERIAPIVPSVVTDNDTAPVSIPTGNTNVDPIKEACRNNENRKKRIIQVLNKSYNIIFSLRDVAYMGDYQYLFFEIRNKGGQAYDIDDINFFKSTAERGIDLTNQKDILPLQYIHNNPKRIEGKTKYQFIAVINKTSINQNKSITVRIKELGGERNLILNLKDQIINNPIKL